MLDGESTVSFYFPLMSMQSAGNSMRCSPVGVQPLKNARADARAIAAELTAVGFDVTLKQDLTQKMMKTALRDFKAHVAGGDEVVYFSGHGAQFGGTNFLVPIDITADSEAQVADDAETKLQRSAMVAAPMIGACLTG
jgi:uncharacterized caspase-like protein